MVSRGGTRIARAPRVDAARAYAEVARSGVVSALLDDDPAVVLVEVVRGRSSTRRRIRRHRSQRECRRGPRAFRPSRQPQLDGLPFARGGRSPATRHRLSASCPQRRWSKHGERTPRRDGAVRRTRPSSPRSRRSARRGLVPRPRRRPRKPRRSKRRRDREQRPASPARGGTGSPSRSPSSGGRPGRDEQVRGRASSRRPRPLPGVEVDRRRGRRTQGVMRSSSSSASASRDQRAPRPGLDGAERDTGGAPRSRSARARSSTRARPQAIVAGQDLEGAVDAPGRPGGLGLVGGIRLAARGRRRARRRAPAFTSEPVRDGVAGDRVQPRTADVAVGVVRARRAPDGDEVASWVASSARPRSPRRLKGEPERRLARTVRAATSNAPRSPRAMRTMSWPSVGCGSATGASWPVPASGNGRQRDAGRHVQ